MRSLVVGIVFLLVLTACSVFQKVPTKEGIYCFKWADMQGMVHKTCEPTLTDCRKASGALTDRHPWYQTVSGCELY